MCDAQARAYCLTPKVMNSALLKRIWLGKTRSQNWCFAILIESHTLWIVSHHKNKTPIGVEKKLHDDLKCALFLFCFVLLFRSELQAIISDQLFQFMCDWNFISSALDQFWMFYYFSSFPIYILFWGKFQHDEYGKTVKTVNHNICCVKSKEREREK